MIDGMFVFDGVVHVLDWTFDDMKEDSPYRDPAMRAEIIEVSRRLTGELFDNDAGRDDLPEALTGSVSGTYDLIFNQSPTDMAIVGSLPFGPGTASELYRDPEHFIKINYNFASAHPERCIFSGGVEPWGRDISFALELIERQVEEMDAKLMKFYPFFWRCDDEKIAYPLYEKCRQLGVKNLQFHLCMPGDSSHDVEIQRPNYLQRAARDFPDMTFIMHHPMPLYFDETLNIAARFNNIHLLVSPLLQLSVFKPRAVRKMMGELLQQVGSDRLHYGSEGAISGNPTRYVRAVADFTIPEDLQEGYGYPQITREDKEKILGRNTAKLLGVDIEAKRAELEVVEV